MVKELTWDTVGISGSSGATGEGMAFVEGTPVMGARVVSWEAGECLCDGGGVGDEVVIREEDTGEGMLGSFHDGFVGWDQGRGGDAAGSMFVDECIDYQLDGFWPL